jgi:hypothetical protein
MLGAICAAAKGPDWAFFRPLAPVLGWLAGISYGVDLRHGWLTRPSRAVPAPAKPRTISSRPNVRAVEAGRLGFLSVVRPSMDAVGLIPSAADSLMCQ